MAGEMANFSFAHLGALLHNESSQNSYIMVFVRQIPLYLHQYAFETQILTQVAVPRAELANYLSYAAQDAPRCSAVP